MSEVRDLRHRLHQSVGIGGLVVFIGTGIWMQVQHVSELPDGPRLLYRSAHLYLMWSSLANLLLSLSRSASGRRWVDGLTSAVFLGVPFAHLAAFFLEPNWPLEERSLSATANQLAFGAVVLLLLSNVRRPKTGVDADG